MTEPTGPMAPRIPTSDDRKSGPPAPRPVPPTGPQDYARLERYVAGPEPVAPPQPRPYLRPGDRLGDDRPRFPLLTWSLLVSILAIAAVAFLIANRSAAPRSAPDSSDAQVVTVPGPSGAPSFSQPGDDGPSVASAGLPPGQSWLGGGAPNTLDPRVGREGDIAHSGSRTPYVAIPLGPGIRIRVCGPADCITVVSTDAGPNRESLLAGRIMDLDIGRWEQVCGMPARFGLCPGSWVRVESSPTLPATDVTP